jgi:hypothetical protein
MRVILSQGVAYDGRGFFERLARPKPGFVHNVKYAAMNWLESVSRVGQSASYDDAHSVVQIATLHLVFYIDGNFLNSFSHFVYFSPVDFPAGRAWQKTVKPGFSRARLIPVLRFFAHCIAGFPAS